MTRAITAIISTDSRTLVQHHFSLVLFFHNKPLTPTMLQCVVAIPLLPALMIRRGIQKKKLHHTILFSCHGKGSASTMAHGLVPIWFQFLNKLHGVPQELDADSKAACNKI